MRPFFFSITFLFCANQVFAQDSLNISRELTMLHHWNSPSDIAVHGDYAYVVTNKIVQIVDVSNVDSPRQATLLEGYNPVHLAVSDDYLIITDTRGGFSVLTPMREDEPPELVGRWEAPIEVHIESYGQSIRIEDDILVIFNSDHHYPYEDERLWFWIIDLTDAEEPELASTIGFRGLPVDWSIDFELLDNILYHIKPDDGMYTVDLDDPYNPEQLNYYEGEFYLLEVNEDFAFICRDRDIEVVDITDPEEFEQAAIFGRFRGHMSLQGNVLVNAVYYWRDEADIYFYDISDLENIDLFSMPDLWYGSRDVYLWDMEFVNQSLYFVGSKGLISIDCSDRDELWWNIEDREFGEMTPGGWIWNVVTQDEIAYVIDCKVNEHRSGFVTGVRILDMSAPDQPEELSFLPINNYRYSIYGFSIYGEYLFATTPIDEDYTYQLRVIDVSDPTQPFLLNEDNYYPFGSSLLLHNDLAILSGNSSDEDHFIKFIDISDAENLDSLGSYETERWVSGFNAVDDYLYFSSGYKLHVLDISDPSDPLLIDNVGTGILGIPKIVDNYLFVKERTEVEDEYFYKTLIFDISERENPQEIAEYVELIAISAVYDKYLLSGYGNKLSILDYADIDDIEELGYYENMYSKVELGLIESYAVVGERSHVAIYDCSEIIKINHPPYWVEYPVDTLHAATGDMIRFSLVAADDDDEDTLSITLFSELLPESAALDSISNGEVEFIWLTDSTDAGFYQPLFVVSDGEFTDSLFVNIAVELVVINHPPVWAEIPADTILVTAGDTLGFTLVAEDIDGDDLHITFVPDYLPEEATLEIIADGAAFFHWETQQSDTGLYNPIFLVSDQEYTDIYQPLIIVEAPDKMNNDPIYADKLLILNAYPNPFNDRTSVSFSLPHPGMVDLRLIDLHGRVSGLISGDYYQPGQHSISLNAGGLPSGKYMLQLRFGKERLVQDVTVVK